MLKNKKVVLFSFFFFFAIFLSVFDIIVEKIYFERYTNKIALDEATKKSKEREAIAKSFLNNAQFTLINIKNLPEFDSFLENQNNKDEIQKLFLYFAQLKPNIMQIRYINKDGKEIIRIDRDRIDQAAYIIKDENLQDKSKRDYFLNAKTMEKNKVQFSALDLNIEHGKIEIPFKSTIRAMMAVSKNDTFDGMLIINYFADDVLKRLTNAVSYDIIIFDKDGYIIAHNDETKNWGKFQEKKYHIAQELDENYKKVFQNGHVKTDTFLARKLDLPLRGEYYMALTFSEVMDQQIREYKQSEYLFEIIFVGICSLILSLIISRYFSSVLFDLDHLEKILKKLQISTKTSKIGFYEYDYTTKTFKCSPEIYELLGLEKEDKPLSKELFLSFFDPQSVEHFERILDGKEHSLEELSFECKILNSGLEYKYIDHKAEYVTQESSKKYLLGSLYDITVMINNQMKLEEQMQYNKSVLNAQSSMIIVTNGEKSYEQNQNLLDFFMCENIKDFEEKYGCICDTFIQEEGFLQKEQNGQTWIDVLTTQRDVQHLVKIKDIYNKIHVFDVVCSKERLKDQFYVVTFNDITPLYWLQNNLELEVKNKTRELSRKDSIINEQSKLAQMGSMIANIAHQWKQPLSVISTTASGIGIRYKMGVNIDKQEIVQDMDDIVERVNYLADNINTFRNFLKDDKKYKNLVLQDEIQTALNISSLMLTDNGIELINNIDYKNKIELMLVSGELPEVIINILNNAKDALIENFIENPWVKLDMFRQDDKVTITIEDNGGGIPENIISKIFDEYFTTKPDNQGTGLGLHMSKRIIEESLGGHIYVHNTPNGAKFNIEFFLSNMRTQQ